MAAWECNLLWSHLFGNSYSELFLLLLQSVYTLATIKPKKNQHDVESFRKTINCISQITYDKNKNWTTFAKSNRFIIRVTLSRIENT